MQKNCRQCQSTFEITIEDLAFYDKISPIFNGKKYAVPAPSLCPDCRQQRRFAWRNERHLYHRTCDLTGKTIISNYGVHTNIKVYEISAWWSDRWDGRDYGREFDFSRTFFEQFKELEKKVPHLGLSVWNSENSDYCNYIGHVKDSYLIFGSVYSRDCYYGSPYYSKDCIDTLVVRECELCYECVDCRKLYHCLYCQDCHSSNDLVFCFDLQGCADCIGCAGLRKKQYCIFNKQFSKEEYETKKKQFNLCDPSVRKRLWQELFVLKIQIPHRYMQSNQVENVSGNYVYQSKNVTDSFYADRSQDCRFCAQVVDLKDCYDNNYTEENELCNEYLGAYQNNRISFSKFCNKVSDSFYCDACHNSRNLFGCIGLKRAEYCILNKQYTKGEYEALVPRIIEDMQKTNQWGEFFPIEISPFGYNETVAEEYFPMSKEEVLKKGWKWHEEEAVSKKYLGPEVKIPDNIKEVGESICDQILLSESTGKPYKIIPQELAFYKKMGLPIPRKCPDQRHKERLTMRNPRKLFERTCGKCEKVIKTTYAPDRPEVVYCEECYLKEIY